MWLYYCSMFCCALLCVHSSFAIILIGKRELVALLCLSSCCLLIVVWLFLTMPRVCLQSVIVVFPDHTHLLFMVVMEECWCSCIIMSQIGKQLKCLWCKAWFGCFISQDTSRVSSFSALMQLVHIWCNGKSFIRSQWICGWQHSVVECKKPGGACKRNIWRWRKYSRGMV